MLSMAVVVFAQRPSDLTRRRIMVDIRLDRERIPVATLHRLIRITMFREAPSIQHVFIIHDPPIGPRQALSTILTFRQDAMVVTIRTVVDTDTVEFPFGSDSKSLNVYFDVRA